ncbi:MAG: hypothetical protein WC516_06500 [Patescibacteria group bacterium]|jgi:hypothetical protein
MPDKIRDKIKRSMQSGKYVVDKLDAIINVINMMIPIIFAGQNPHKVNDTTDVITVSNPYDLDTVIDLEQQLIDNYETHIGSTSYHLGADSTNVVTEVGLAKECYDLLNNLATKYEANRINVTTHHGGSGDTVNAVTATTATTKATAILLANDIKTMLLAHMARTEGTTHGAADAVNGVALAAIDDLVPATATWTQIATLMDAIRAAFVAHIAYTTSSVHAGADSTNGPTVAATGTVTTAVYAGLNELKTDMNAHFVEFGTYHAIKDVSIQIESATASTLATAKTMVTEMKLKFNDHISRVDQEVVSSIATLDEKAY